MKSKQKKRGFILIELLAVIATIVILVAPLMLAVNPQDRANERARQNRCRLNLQHIYTAMVEYGNDYDGYICPGYSRHTGQTWEDILKPYTKGGKHYRYDDMDGSDYKHYMQFYCPTRYSMRMQGMSGYQTNYCANGELMGINMNPGHPDPLRKFSDFMYAHKLALLIEIDFWYLVARPNVSVRQIYSGGIDFVHNGSANFLMLDGQVKNLKGDATKNEPMQAWLKYIDF